MNLSTRQQSETTIYYLFPPVYFFFIEIIKHKNIGEEEVPLEKKQKNNLIWKEVDIKSNADHTWNKSRFVYFLFWRAVHHVPDPA